jgi:trimeric autotransporter adhesin
MAVGLMPAVAQAAPIVFSQTPIAGWSTNGQVRKVLIVGNTVYAGGTFTQVTGPGGSPTLDRSNLAAFDIKTGNILTNFSADTNARVEALASDGSRLFVGGDFTTIKGVAKTRLAAVDLATGNVFTGFTAGATSHVYALKTYGSRLYVGGAFGNLGGQPRGRIGAVSTGTGAVDPNFNPNANDSVHAIVTSPDGQTVYVGGVFTSIGGGTRGFLAPVSATNGALLPLTFQYPLYANSVGNVWDLDITPAGDRLLAAEGGFENQVASFSTTTGQRLWYYQVDGDTQAVRYYNGNVYFGFHEGDINDHTVRMEVADATTGALLTSYKLPIDSFFGVWDIDASPDALVLGGEFLHVNNVATDGVAILPPQITDPVPPTPPSNVHITATSANSVSLAWDPGTDNQGVAGYRVLRGGVEVGYPIPTNFTDIGLSSASNYTYTVQTIDNAGNLSASTTPLPAGTDTTLIAHGDSWKYLDNGSDAGTSWRAPGFDDSAWASGPSQLGYGDGDENTVVGYGPNANQKYVTTYFRRQFNVADPSQVSALNMQLLRDDGAVVYLNGTEVARSNMPAGTITTSALAITDVTGAAENQYYAYSANPALLVAGTNTLAVEIHQQYRGSSDLSFDMILGAARRLGPPAPSGLQGTAPTGTSASLTWTAPNGPFVIAGYRVYRDGALVGSPSGTSFTDPGLTSATAYSYQVSAVDDHSQESPLSTAFAITTPDDVGPSTPTGLVAGNVGGTRASIAWNPSSDNVAVSHYDVIRDGVVVGTPSTPSYIDNSVVPSTTYSYTVDARDAAGNVSGVAGPLTVTTTDGVDSTPPSTPANLTVTSVGATNAALSWQPSTDDIGVAYYVVTRNGVDVGTPVGTTFTDTSLAAGATYSYTVTAVDASLNASGASNVASATTHLASETIVPVHSVWKYLDNGSNQGSAWTANSFNDSTWASGPAELGFGDGDEATVVGYGPNANQKYVTTYFRKQFTLTDPSQVTALNMQLLRDDGAVVYVNGVEVARSNMPTGVITSSTLAINDITGAGETTYYPFTISPSMLVQGTNTISVEIHQQWRGSSDLSFDAGLSAQYG